VNTPEAQGIQISETLQRHWRVPTPDEYARMRPLRPPTRTLVLSCALFGLTLLTCLAAGRQFAVSYAHGQAASFEEFGRSLTLIYKNPAALLAGLPFALTLMTILLAHELGHFFACRHHHIHSSYPFFLPAPNLIGTFGAFILIRSPIGSRRALFDVGASGPIVGFLFAAPAMIYGIAHAQIVPSLNARPDVIFGAPLMMQWLAHIFYPKISASTLLMNPVGRAAWVGFFATSLNLLPAAQLDGGHILRSLSPRIHRFFTLSMPFVLVVLGYFLGVVWYVFAALLLILRFMRVAPVYDETPLDPPRKWIALATLAIFVLCFIPAPIS
jgi:membrane-associated protease RseP (regulator of RpoE activity)